MDDVETNLHNHEDDGRRHDTCPGCALLDLDPDDETSEIGSELAAAARLAAEHEVDQSRRPPEKRTLRVGETGMIPIRAILVDPRDNVARGQRVIKEAEPRLKRLIATMGEEGQQQAVRVRPLVPPIDGKHYRLIFGFRRVTAAKALGWSKVEAKVVEADDVAAVKMGFAESCREQPSRYDLAKSMLLAKQTNMDLRTCALRAGLSDPDDAFDLCRIAERCPEELLEQFRVNCGDRMFNMLSEVSLIDEGSPQATHAAMMRRWEELRFAEMVRLNPKPPEPPKPKKKKAPQVRRLMTLSELSQLEGEVETARRYFREGMADVQPISDEMRVFGLALIDAFRRKKLMIR